MSWKKFVAGLIAGFSLCNFGQVFASQISVASVTASSTFFTYDVNNLINGSGLSGGLHNGDFHNKWLTNTTSTGQLTFDFGSVFNVTSTEIWNYGPGCCGNERSTKDLAIQSSLDGITWTSVGTYVLSQPVTDPFSGEAIALNTTARYFKFDLNSTYAPSNYIGLSEVQFFSAAAVPEPETYAMLLAGLGLVGFAARRRQKTA
jgi:hypothetical protein